VVKQFSADSYRVNLRVPRARLDDGLGQPDGNAA
jgi:hypothetical protein